MTCMDAGSTQRLELERLSRIVRVFHPHPEWQAILLRSQGGSGAARFAFALVVGMCEATHAGATWGVFHASKSPRSCNTSKNKNHHKTVSELYRPIAYCLYRANEIVLDRRSWVAWSYWKTANVF